MKTIKVKTWLPVFSGFYESIWDTSNDEECEIEHINEARNAAGMPEIGWDDVSWDYDRYHKTVSQGIAREVSDALVTLNMVASYVYEGLRSPREYNFSTDSIDVEYTLNAKNVKNIVAYLRANKKAFDKYISDKYTSYSGFISFHSNNSDVWLADTDATLNDVHKLGSVLNFILLIEEGNDFEIDIREDLTGNGAYLEASNYEALMPRVADIKGGK